MACNNSGLIKGFVNLRLPTNQEVNQLLSLCVRSSLCKTNCRGEAEKAERPIVDAALYSAQPDILCDTTSTQDMLEYNALTQPCVTV